MIWMAGISEQGFCFWAIEHLIIFVLWGRREKGEEMGAGARTVVGALCNDVDDFAACAEEAFLADADAPGKARAAPGAVSDTLDLVANDA